MSNNQSLHLSRPAEPVHTEREITVNLRTIEHYRLALGISEDIDPDLCK